MVGWNTQKMGVAKQMFFASYRRKFMLWEGERHEVVHPGRSVSAGTNRLMRRR
jgi:hypothetical protein